MGFMIGRKPNDYKPRGIMRKVDGIDGKDGESEKTEILTGLTGSTG
jgi:hypothetical protein